MSGEEGGREGGRGGEECLFSRGPMKIQVHYVTPTTAFLSSIGLAH